MGISKVQSGIPFGTTSGTDTYTCSVTPIATSYIAGSAYVIKFTNANTGAATLNLNSQGAKAIKKNASQDLVAGDILAGQELLCVYDGTNFQLQVDQKGSTRRFTLANTFDVTSASETDITGMAASVEANSTYEIMINYNIGCNGVGGTQFGYKFPVGCDFLRCHFGRTASATAIVIATSKATASTGLISSIFNTAISTAGNYTAFLTLKTGANAGTFQVTFASVTGSQTSSIISLSSMRITKYTPE